MSVEGWIEKKLGNVAELKNGKSRPKDKGKYPVYGGNGILEYANTYNVIGETIIIGRVGAYCGATYFETRQCWISDNALYAKANKDINSLFLYYLLKNKNLNQFAGGSSHPLLTQGRLNELEILIPDYLTQQKISSIISSLDDKIELNDKTNQTLESIAQALFREWFVDFNFPGSTGEMQDSELGEIPKGWRAYKVGELVDSVSITHKFQKSEVIFLNTGDIEEGKVLHNKYSNVEGLPGQAKKSIKKLDILFTEIRPANKRYALIDFDATDDYVVSTKLMVLRSISKIHPIVVYNFLTNSNTLNELQHLAESRSGTFPQITFTQVKDLKIVLPTDKLLEKYEQLAWSIFQQIKNNESQSETLIQLRDSLLPKLMKGEITLT
jgi:type I restriction enzyme S subunit